MNDAFPLYQHINIFDRSIEQPVCLDYFQTLVHHRRRIDGNLSTHFPIGMAQCLG